MKNNMKQNIKCVLRLAARNFRAWGQNYRMFMLLLLLITIFVEFCTKLNSFADSLGERINILGVLPNIYNAGTMYFGIIIQLGIILMFSNAPFRSEDSLFRVMRTGYAKWCVGQIVYIIGASFVYTVTLFLLTNICCIGNIGYSSKWGRVFIALSDTNTRFRYDLYKRLPLRFSPLEALLHTMLMIFMISVILGLVMFFMESVFGKASGTFAAAALVFLGIMPMYCRRPASVARLSPCSLTWFYFLDGSGMTTFPTMTYAYTFLAVLTILLIAANIFIYSNKRIRHNIYAAEL